MHLILLWALIALIGRVQCKCSLVPIVDEQRLVAYSCTHADLQDLDGITSEADWIEFTVSRFHLIPDNAFWRFKNLKRLSFYNCHINFISPDAFSGLDGLEWLIFHGSKIHVARTAWFRPMKDLRKLIFDRCGLVYVESGVFRLLPRLEILGLRDNDLDCLSIEDLSQLRMLKVIRIDENPLFCECKQRLDEYFTSRNIVQEIECMNPMSICKGYQCMTPITFQVLPSILTKQRLNEFQKERMWMRGNEFQTNVFDSLHKLPDKTTWIEIVGLQIDVLPRYTFFRFGNSLQNLDLNNCKINTIENEAFAGLHKLQRLSLVGNQFSVLGSNWFRDFVSLEQLNLQRNNIQQIERTALWHVGDSLRHLDISDNLLRCITIEELAGLKKLERLDGTGNPWLCSCNKNLQNFLTQRNIRFDINTGQCYESEKEIIDGGTGWSPPQTYIRNTTTTTGIVHWASFEDTIKQTNISVITHPLSTPPTEINIASRQPSLYTGSCYPETTNGRSIYSCKAITSVEDLNLIPSTARTLTVTLSNIKKIPQNTFIRFNSYLSKLELQDCGIVNIERLAFSKLYNLQYLSLRGNQLKSINEDIVYGMGNLEHLDLSHNNIYRITNNVFDYLPNLIALDISENAMNCIGVEYMAQRLHKLISLNVVNNPWSCLCGTKLAQFLDSLDIKYDKNSLILKEDCYATSEPMLTSTPAFLSIVTEAPLRNETITGTCTKISDNKIGIRYRCSNGNLLLLQSLPTDAVAIEFLDGLLFRLPPRTFSKFTNLRELVIINSGLSSMEQETFHGLDKLENLTIQENSLGRIGANWFIFENLQRLNLRGNSIKYIEPASFQHLNRLIYLNLEGNDLKCIYTSDLDNMKNIYIVEFSENPLKWRCRLELEQYLDAKKIKFIKIENSCEGKKLMRNLLLQNRTDGSFDCTSDCSRADSIKLYPLIFLIPLLRILLYEIEM